MREKYIRIVSFVLALTTLTACGNQSVPDNLEETNTANDAFIEVETMPATDIETTTLSTVTSTSKTTFTTAITTDLPSSSAEVTTAEVTTTVDPVELQKQEEERKKAEEEAKRKKEEEEKEKAEQEKILAEQRNSFSMMYYLAITAEDIRSSKENRLVLEEIYTSLLNDINPGAVDEITQEHLRNLRDIIKKYLNISTKRERLQFIYNQEKAAAIRSAVPNPLAVLSVASSGDWKKLALTIGYTAIDSYNNYKKASESADLAFIMSGWELDDEEEDAVMKNRDRAFDYMVDMVQKYNLDGQKTLNEKSIEKFAQICHTENASEKIMLLKAEENTYSLLGNYWLQLAEAYFETSHYQDCLDCVDKYNQLSTGIYRKDYNYLQILPKAIVSAQDVYKGNKSKYEQVISKFAAEIEENTTSDNWSSRYFAAQVYLDLYAKTNKHNYIEKAYKITKENVGFLLKEQRSLNEAYLNDIVKQTAVEPDYRYMNEQQKEEAEKEYKAEKKRVKEYNNALEEARETELPSLYEPLIINCELLFSLADELKINDSEKQEIRDVLQTNSNGIFMVKPINTAYSFKNSQSKYPIDMNKDEIIIPAFLLTADSTVTVTVSENGSTQTFKDCAVTKVERKGSDINNYKAYITSKTLKKYEWTADSKIEVNVTFHDAYDKTSTYNLYVSTFEEHWYGDKVVFSVQ